jgi:hypothetical protein
MFIEKFSDHSAKLRRSGMVTCALQNVRLETCRSSGAWAVWGDVLAINMALLNGAWARSGRLHPNTLMLPSPHPLANGV